MSQPKSVQKLNDDQRAALDLSRDLLVVAGAGAGKTEVLGLRILALLEHGHASIKDIVAFTFTKKAAAEMRERVQAKLIERLSELGDEESDRRTNLIQARRDFDKNRITTMHGFCQRLLNEYAWETDLEPNAPLLDERQQRQVQDAAVRKVMLHSDAENEPEILAALTGLGRVAKPRGIAEALRSILRERDTLEPAMRLSAKVWEAAELEVERRTKAHDALVNAGLVRVRELLKQLDWASVNAAKEGDALRLILTELLEAADTPEGFVGHLASATPSILGSSNNALKHSKTGTKANWDADDLALARGIAHQLSEYISEYYAPLLKLSFHPQHERHVGESVRHLNTLSAKLLEAYTEERAGRLDFSELEIAAIHLLSNNQTAREEVNARIKYLLIDEFQDTNPTQEKLFRYLIESSTAPGRFFAVGDAKQAIYGFRRSDVRIFNRFESEIRERNVAVKDRPQELAWGLEIDASQTAERQAERQSGLIKLVTNYRTIGTTLEVGNTLFENIFNVADRQEYDPEPQAMQTGKLDTAPDDKPVEIHMLRKNSGYDDHAVDRFAEATFIARRILELHKNKIPYDEMTILVRSSTKNQVYRQVFARAGIPLLVRGEAGLFATQEAVDCVNLLRVLARPADDVALIGVLRSSFVGVDDTWLTSLGMETNRYADLLSRVTELNKEVPDERVKTFLKILAPLNQRVGRDTPALILQRAIAETGYLLAVQNGPDREQRGANVMRLMELVRELQQNTPSLATLVRDMETRMADQDKETQGVPEGSFDGVELMTIHKSKGLEFKTVFIPDLGKTSSGGGFPPMICQMPEADGQLGLRLPRFDDNNRGDSRPCFEGWRADTSADLRATSEEKRVLYVAYTRAIERVIMVGTCGSKSVSENSWAGELLTPLGAATFDSELSADLPIALHWYPGVESFVGQSTEAEVRALEKAIEIGKLPLVKVIDDSLVAPLSLTVAPDNDVDRQAADFGTRVHAELERRIKCRSRDVEFGTVSLDKELLRHTENGMATIGALPKAREIPEFGILTSHGKRRIDLLRALGDGRYQIIDYKSDAVAKNQLAAKAEGHREQLEEYREALSTVLESRNEAVDQIELFVCFTAPEGLQPSERLVQIG
ncbi:UvrD-helicase domain-containing protein [Planctomycetota bacterium]|nr:UvrD-helicase domain-containing protein [Planctomycetota bacterium]